MPTSPAAEPTRDYSACIIAGEREGVWNILDLWRGHLEFAALKQQVITLARRWRANRVLLEGDHVGRSLRSDITGNRMLPAATQLVLVQPEGGKLSRMIAQTDKIAEGRILIPRDANWLEAFRRELIAFPSGKYDDQVDALSQLLNYVHSNRGRALANTNHATGRRVRRHSRRQRSSRLRLR
ncbi:MAG: phage terminase large subunit [Azospirillaceae bacterium]